MKKIISILAIVFGVLSPLLAFADLDVSSASRTPSGASIPIGATIHITANVPSGGPYAKISVRKKFSPLTYYETTTCVAMSSGNFDGNLTGLNTVGDTVQGYVLDFFNDSNCTDQGDNSGYLEVYGGDPSMPLWTIVAATCSDGVQNQDETGIDTGGICGGVSSSGGGGGGSSPSIIDGPFSVGSVGSNLTAGAAGSGAGALGIFGSTVHDYGASLLVILGAVIGIDIAYLIYLKTSVR